MYKEKVNYIYFKDTPIIYTPINEIIQIRELYRQKCFLRSKQTSSWPWHNLRSTRKSLRSFSFRCWCWYWELYFPIM